MPKRSVCGDLENIQPGLPEGLRTLHVCHNDTITTLPALPSTLTELIIFSCSQLQRVLDPPNCKVRWD